MAPAGRVVPVGTVTGTLSVVPVLSMLTTPLVSLAVTVPAVKAFDQAVWSANTLPMPPRLQLHVRRIGVEVRRRTPRSAG